MVFKALAKAQIKDIAELLLKDLAKRIEKQIKLHLTWDDEAAEYLAQKGFDPDFGARPLRRLLTKVVETELSRKIIAGTVSEGDAICMKLKNDAIVFE